MMSAEMPAAVIRQQAAPSEHALWPIPSRGPGQALLRVTAAPLSPLDRLCASGTSSFGAPRLPYILGTQGVGIVVELLVISAKRRRHLGSGEKRDRLKESGLNRTNCSGDCR